VTHLRDSADFRSNAGFTEVAGESGIAHLRVIDGRNGLAVFERDIDTTPFMQFQTPVSGSPELIAEFRIASGNARILAYGSSIDNRSGDAIYIPARVAPAEARTEAAPAISATGVNGTRWSSEVVVATLLPGSANTAFAITFADPVGKGLNAVVPGSVFLGSVRFADIVQTLFQRSSAIGLLRAEFPAGVIATSRIATPSSGGGSAGQFVPFLDTRNAVADGATATIIQAESSSSFRTNVGAANLGGTTARVRFAAFDAAGTAVGSTERAVDPLQVVQVAVASFVASPIPNGRVDVQVLEAARGMLIYGSVIDNRSGDAIYIPAQ
jgi:hypothetical protein